MSQKFCIKFLQLKKSAAEKTKKDGENSNFRSEISL